MTDSWIDLYWLPLGAGGSWVRRNGRIYECFTAAREHRGRRDLYHSALQVHHDGVTYAVEMGPVWSVAATDRGVIREGPVGAVALGRFRAFRYEVRCWPGGRIPDIAEAVGGVHRVSSDTARADAVLAVLPRVPALTWGRDELGTGDMWNSNSVVAWALGRTGHDMQAITPPDNGRAPGWHAGLTLAARKTCRRTPMQLSSSGRAPRGGAVDLP